MTATIAKRPMRRSDRELSEDEALELMRSDAPYCVLSCVENDEKRRALGALIEKYSSDYRERGARYFDGAVGKTSVTAIDLRLVTGKASR